MDLHAGFPRLTSGDPPVIPGAILARVGFLLETELSC
jgi:hypothetical protein